MTTSSSRSAEALRRLRAALNDPERRVVALRGPAGVGKSRLARAALAAVADEGAICGAGAYRERSGQGPLAPILSALSQALAAAMDPLLEPAPVFADLSRSLGPALEVLRRAGVRGLPSPVSEVTISAVDRRGGVLLVTDAVIQLLRWLQAFGRPLVLLVEHWPRGGPDAAALLAAMIEAADRLTLLVTERDESPPRALAAAEAVWTLDLRATSVGDPSVRTVARSQSAGPAMPLAARRLRAALALWPEPVSPPLLAFALGLTTTAADRGLARLAAAGATRPVAGAVQIVEEVREDALQGIDAQALAGELSERLVLAGPEGALAALELRLMGGLDEADPNAWRDRFAHGAVAARARLDADAAGRFAEAAWTLRSRSPSPEPETDRLILRQAVMAAADRRAPDLVEVRGRQLIEGAEHRLDLGADYALIIDALRSAGDPERAWTMACEGLARFHIAPPERVTPWRLAAAALLWRLRRRAVSKTDAGVIDGLTYVAHAAATLSFERDPAMAALIAFTSARHVSRSAEAAAFWTSVDTFLSAILGDFETAARLGRLGLSQLTETSPFRAATLYRTRYFGEIWVEPLARLRPHAETIYRVAMLEGDLTFAATALRNGLLIGWRTAPSLPQLREAFIEAESELARLGDPKLLLHATLQRRAIEGVMRFEGAQPLSPESAELEVEPLLALELASLRGDWPRAEALARRYAPVRRYVDSHPGGIVWRFHEGLARLKTGRRLRKADLRYIRRAAVLNPADHRPKLLILAAEALRARGRLAESLIAYADAVAAAEAADCRLEAGLAAECAAAAAREAGRHDLAGDYDARAAAIWRAWGAVCKLPSDPALEAAEASLLAAEREGRARSRLLAEVSHELRTPLQGMQGLLDLAASGQAELDLGSFRDMFASLKRVVDDLTDFGALTAGGVRLVRGPVAIGELVRSELQAIRALEPQDGAAVELQLADDLPPVVETDGVRLRQVLRNLLTNALRYGGPAPVTLSAAWRNGRLEVSVADRGLGLSAADLRLIFEPFQRGAHAGDGHGLGLGLALSRRIVEQLGGQLTAENRPEGGACFAFSIPAPLPGASAEAARPGRPMRILVCEDVPLLREVVAANLRRAGHEVVAVADGADGWDAWRAEAFDAAVVDWNLPGLGGAALVGRLARRAPVLVLTASSDLAIEQAARSAGARQVLRKPVSAAELAEAVAALGASTAAPAPEDAAFEAQMGALRTAAEADIAARARTLIGAWRAGEPISAEDVHRLAGLAAQFDRPELAAAADALERGLRRGDRELAAAFLAFAEAADQSAPAAPSSR